MSLTNAEARNAKPLDKAYKLFDGKGLFLLVETNGSKYWRYKYRFNKKEKTFSIGVYPNISLAEAREKRDEANKLLNNGTDPSLYKQIQKHTSQIATANTFEAVTEEWYRKVSPTWSEKYREKVRSRLKNYIYPYIGKHPISEINAPTLLAMLRHLEQREAVYTAHRIRQLCGQILRYAVAAGLAERDSSHDLRGALSPVKTKHFATITDPEAIGGLLRAIETYKGNYQTQCALRLAPLLFVRPSELRFMQWSELDLEKAEWRIPAVRMKQRILHIVPLATQAVKILQDLRKYTGNGKFVFPSTRTPTRCMSENTVLAALRRMGYDKDDMTGHGFRSMASTLLNEHGWNRDAIERQLAHSERNSVRASYNYAEYLPERRTMMQFWADYLDLLKVKSPHEASSVLMRAPTPLLPIQNNPQLLN